MREMNETIQLYCICIEDRCYCTNLIPVPFRVPALEIPCPECDMGFHVWEPGGERDFGGAQYIGPPQ